MHLTAQQQAAQRNLSYLLAEKLGQRILAGEYVAGDILPGEIELGDLFGVSRTAVREAVKILAAKGMLLPRPRIGTRVLPRHQWNYLDQELLSWWVTRENFDDVMAHFLIMRTSLEPQACALAAINAAEDEKYKLVLLMEEMSALHKRFDRERWISVDAQFHRHIYEISGNPFLSSFANLFSSIYQNYFRAIVSDEVVKLGSHQAIVDAILASDSPAALAACQRLLAEND
ncbi:FadR family transcriptional regulator [Sodalis ligni]|jgi:DNA-binding FadR family transcriptional regulator|uniref:GntR family transcriptional regulator n=1 Tax=Sodalis ligni TaxID=2697027 RepID=A0A4R1NMF6_9GAMM|nr:FadR/GntR family transcriptional regulator [Sodalis ligni]QWA11194.1 FadR family transcriptional regulator [Sodalis ligni]TCL05440.1 GntR family transcriptional regulator [Sodalis ligni]